MTNEMNTNVVEMNVNANSQNENVKNAPVKYAKDTNLCDMDKDSEQYIATARRITNADNAFLVTSIKLDYSTAKGDTTALKVEMDNILKQCTNIRQAALSLSVSILTIKEKELWRPFENQNINGRIVKNWSDFVETTTGMSKASAYRYKDIGAICTDIAGKALPAFTSLSSAKLNELRLEKPTKDEMYTLNEYAIKNDITLTDDNFDEIRKEANTDKKENTKTVYKKKSISSSMELAVENAADIDDDNIIKTARAEILKKKNTRIVKTITDNYAGHDIVTFLVEASNTLRAYTFIGGKAQSANVVDVDLTANTNDDDGDSESL